MTAAAKLAQLPHRHDGRPCYAHHHVVRRPNGELVRITTLVPDPSLIRLPNGWTLTGETWS